MTNLVAAGRYLHYSASYRHHVRLLSTASTSAPNPALTPEGIPIPSGKWPFVGHLPRIIKTGTSVENWAAMHNECGDIFQCSVANKDFVVTRSVHHAREILMNQGKYPERPATESWIKVFEINKWPAGIPFAREEDWKRKRKVLGETLLMGSSAREYIPAVVPAANRFIDCLQDHLLESGRINPSRGVPLRTLVGMFALEAVMKVVVGVDFPALTIPIQPNAMNFQLSVENMFSASARVEMNPLSLLFQFGPFRELKREWEELYRYPQETLKPVLEFYEKNGVLPPETEGTVLPKLIQQYELGELTLDEVLGIGVQAIAAGVDTTSQSIEYLLYNLACNPDVQDRLASEIDAALERQHSTSGTALPVDFSRQDYESQKFCFAAVKESMRVSPIVGVHARVLQQEAHLEGGYILPKGKCVLVNYKAMTEDEKLFPRPDVFLPERFLKESNSTFAGCPYSSSPQRRDALENGHAVLTDPYAAIPFGHGARKCVGKGLAELEVNLLAMALFRKFRVFYDGPPLRQHEFFLLRPAEPLWPHFRFEPRSASPIE